MLRVFGIRLPAAMNAASDVDILATFDSDRSLFDLIGLSSLEAFSAVTVDVSLEGGTACRDRSRHSRARLIPV